MRAASFSASTGQVVQALGICGGCAQRGWPLGEEYKYGFVQRAWAAKTHEQESVMKSKPGYMRDGWNISLIFYLLLLR